MSLVGYQFAGYSSKSQATAIWRCTKHEPDNIYVENIHDAEDTTVLSPRAIGRTFHEATEEGDGWWVSGWSQRIPKSRFEGPK